jgi:hypothetical protein
MHEDGAGTEILGKWSHGPPSWYGDWLSWPGTYMSFAFIAVDRRATNA